MRLIHYSTKPLLEVVSRPYNGNLDCGCYKTPGLWVSVEGPDDWPTWCRNEQWGLGGFIHATEVVLHDNHNVRHLRTARHIDSFTARFKAGCHMHDGIDWHAVREQWQGLIIAPYCWQRRLSEHTMWYYTWDCASGVIWDANAVKELRPAEVPNMAVMEEAS